MGRHWSMLYIPQLSSFCKRSRKVPYGSGCFGCAYGKNTVVGITSLGNEVRLFECLTLH